MSRVEILVTWGLLIIVALGVASVSRHLSQIENKLEEPSAYATKLAEAFSAKVSKEMYASSLFDTIVNRDYDGDIMDVGSVLNILSFSKLSEKDYSGANLSVDDLNESNGQLVIDKQKSFYFKVKTIDKFKS